MGDPLVTSPARRTVREARCCEPTTKKETGEQVGAVWMPAEESGSPMTYLVDGNQYVVVTIGDGNSTSEYRAFTLPER